METDRYTTLIHRKLSKQISEPDRLALEKWCLERPENAERYREVSALWQLYQQQEATGDFNEQESWDRLASALDLQDKIETPATDPQGFRSKRLKPRPILPLGYWLAAAVLLIVVGILVLMPFKGSDPSIRYVTKSGEIRKHDLPDGSSVHLNNASMVKISSSFGVTERMLELTGEAFFEVKKDTVPFVVSTANAEIRVLGTSFYVQGFARETRVVVSSGIVAFQSRSNRAELNIILTANEVSFCSGDMPVQPSRKVDAADYFGWRAGKLIYKERRLDEIILDLERTFDITIETTGNVSTKALVSGWFFKDEGPEYILGTLCATLGFHFSDQNGKYIISNK